MKNTKTIGIAITLFAVLIAAYLGYRNYQSINEGVAPGVVSETEKADIVSKVAKLMLVPKENPVLVKVDNADQLVQQQAFFTGAQNGDVVILFPQTAKAIIYSPSRNVIVNSGPIQAQGNASAAPTTESKKTTSETKK